MWKLLQNVVDFTKMLPDEIQMYFQQHSNVCGRFEKSQLDSITIQIPSRVLYSQTQFHKMFLLALFIVMGTTLFSCAAKNGKQQKIDTVEIVKDSTNQNFVIIDATKTAVQNHTEPVSTIKKNIERPIITGVVSIDAHPAHLDTINNPIDYNAIFTLVALDSKPYSPKGFDQFYEFIKANYVAPNKTENPSGRIFISFIVEKNGSLTNFRILRDLMENGEELIRVLKTAEKWIPGKFNNHIVRCSYNLPFSVKPTK